MFLSPTQGCIVRLKSEKCIIKIIFFKYGFQEEPTVHMALMLKVNVRLREIHLAHYDMRDFGAARLTENLLDNLTLTHLDLKR